MACKPIIFPSSQKLFFTVYNDLTKVYDFVMLPKENRLKKKSAFNATYKTGKIIRQDGITMFCGKKKTSDYPTKIGFVVSKKIHKRAVKRNRIKRLMRESLRLMNKENQLSCDCMSLIFVASQKQLNKHFKDIDNSIKKLVSKL